ncbi:diacylglycerol O-acyltransferase [Aeromicrobium sp. Root236]|uniref:WS/DGAT/MGAT family O-acyltransferase n=1 Tax=Aeromicrobium sp. Root236 TaxID=1736498 RepID=UPI0006FCF9DC|nr:wax ester/triacylglycerol synthase family O-acyltransferase [Aeromicrobium sp. Root236]KRC65543.1 diacylglycerol O-acyltransferase [Aeromicrobium sp. Root236]
MDRLSGLDASFLYLESGAQLMHVCGLIVVDPATMPGGYDFATFKEQLAERVSDVAMFNRKLKFVPGQIDFPVWVTDDEFDIDRHVHRLAVPSPGGEREVSEVAGHLAGIPLDRARPLWEMHVLEGLANGKIAVFSKMHHASVDGVSGSNMISYLCSLEPDAPPLDTSAGEHLRAPSDLELFGRGVVSTVAKPWQLARLAAPTVRTLVETASRARKGTAMAAPLTAPRTSFNGTITGHRSIAYTDVALDDIKAIKKAVPGATVNDVVLALSGGALRRYLMDRGELPDSSLLASVPVSVRNESTRTGGRNKVSSIFCKLGTDVEDPLERITEMAVANAHAKDHHSAVPADTLQEWAEFAAPRTFGLAVRMVSDLRLAERAPVIHNLVISNVPGPPVPLYFVGSRIDALYPLGPIFHGAGLNITVMSNNGEMHIGAIACSELMPGVWDLINQFPIELEAMKASVLG